MSTVAQAAMRRNLAAFLIKVFETLHPGQPVLEIRPYLQAICHHLTEVSTGGLSRLVITVPPRHLKSISASVALPAWLLGKDPAVKIMVASYSVDLARQHASQCRTVMESAWYRELFPGTQISERGNRQLELITTSGGMRKAVSVGGSVTGFGADLIVVDDCMKADEAASEAVRLDLVRWFDGTLMTRLNNKAEGRIISIQQRLHEDDLPAYLLDKGYHHLDLPAFAEKVQSIPTSPNTFFRRGVGDLLNPDRESRDTLEQLRRELGPAVFAAQYQQNPAVPDGNLIRLEWFSTYDNPAPRHCYHKVVQSWDTAATASPTSDWSVCMTWGYYDRDWYLLDVLRKRLEYPDLKRAVLAQIQKWMPDKVLIERASTGFALVQELRAEGRNCVVAYQSKGDKQERLIAQTAELESGRFVLPEAAPWLELLLSELRVFPSGRHDDQVDALSQFIHFQKVNYGWVEQERTPTGRPMRNLRLRSRPVMPRRRSAAG